MAPQQGSTLIFTKLPYNHSRVTAINPKKLSPLGPIIWEELPNKQKKMNQRIYKYSNTRKISILWMEATPPPPSPKHPSYEQQRSLNIFVNLFFCYLIPDAWAYRVQKEVKKKSWEWFGHSFADYVFTQLWFVVSGTVYSGIELSPQPGNFEGKKNSPTGMVLIRSSPYFLMTTPV